MIGGGGGDLGCAAIAGRDLRVGQRLFPERHAVEAADEAERRMSEARGVADRHGEKLMPVILKYQKEGEAVVREKYSQSSAYRAGNH